MLSPIDNYFLKQDEPVQSCLQFLREYILALDSRIAEEWKYIMPMYYFAGKMCCYLWVHKKYRQPYIGIVEGSRVHHPDLLTEKRARMKILLVDPAQDVPMEKVDDILYQMLALYKSH
jgi:hypothetical protein